LDVNRVRHHSREPCRWLPATRPHRQPAAGQLILGDELPARLGPGGRRYEGWTIDVCPWLAAQAGEQQEATPVSFPLAWSLSPRSTR
jgi:hypothetical protein